MRMIPPHPLDTHSQAEKRIFDRLRFAFDGEAGYIAYHSLSLVRHACKRFGEIDFLICCPLGLYVIEVKGGKISCQDGVWRYADRHGIAHEAVESPFRQAESALHGLMEKLRDGLSRDLIEQFSIGYGVIFPDCEWRINGAEWDEQIVADARTSKNIENWLCRLFAYWRTKDGAARRVDVEALEILQNYLRPEFDTAGSSHRDL